MWDGEGENSHASQVTQPLLLNYYWCRGRTNDVNNKTWAHTGVSGLSSLGGDG